jgi:hypothetical protein
LLENRCQQAFSKISKSELGRDLGMNLEGDCHEVEVTPNLELLVTFEMSFIHISLQAYT